LEGIIQKVGSAGVDEHGLPPIDGWADQEGESVFGNVSSLHDHASTKTLVSLVIAGTMVV
jgi:hypothetical protein